MCFSKVFFFSKYLSGYRREHSCQSGLLNFVDNCKKSLDNQQIYAAILTDLSKVLIAFNMDCLFQSSMPMELMMMHVN